MMFEDLEASSFSYSTTYYDSEFEDVLRGIITCYSYMIEDEIQLINDENIIRDKLVNDYLNNNTIREQIKLNNYLFDPEVPEAKGRSDIKIQTSKTFIDTKAYYIIECKRLDNQNTFGETGLNAKYIKNGICRFVTDYYSSYFGINGMIGFVVEELNIESNTSIINSLLSKDYFNDQKKQVNANTVQEIIPIQLSEKFNYSYTSTHQVNEQKQIVLYHLMLDFSKNIEI